MKLTTQEVLKIASLARLEPGPEEVATLQEQLSKILGYVEKLNALDVTGIEPMAHAVEVPTPFREDVVRKDTTREASLQNAPDREDDFFKVPKVIA